MNKEVSVVIPHPELETLCYYIRFVIVDTAMNMDNSNPMQFMMNQGKLSSNEQDILTLLQQAVVFTNGVENFSKYEYYVVKCIMSQQVLGTPTQKRAGFIYLLIQSSNHLPVSCSYDTDKDGLESIDTQFFGWLLWKPEHLYWLIFDPTSLRINGTLQGSLCG